MDIMDPLTEDYTKTDRMQSIWMRMNEKIARLESARKKLNVETKELENRLNKVVVYLAGSRERKQKSQKIVLTSLAVAISSFSCGMIPKFTRLSKSAFPISLVVGIGSLTWCLYHLKDVWYTFADISSVLRELYEPADVSDTETETATAEDDEKLRMNITVPDDAIAAISLKENSEIYTKKRSCSSA